MKVLVAGSRLWEDETLVRRSLNEVWRMFGYPEMEIIHGNDPTGADMMSDQYAVERGWTLTVFKPNWTEDGKKAHDVRNEKMMKYGADMGLVFFSERSPKPEKIIEGMKANGIPYMTFWSEEDEETEDSSE